MNEFRVGDVVYLNSEDRIEMTIVEIHTEVTCAYFNEQTHKFEEVTFPINALTKVR